MGASYDHSKKDNENKIDENKTFPSESLLPLLLLSFTKIQDFKAYFEKYSELYQNKNELIQIFIDLIKNEESVDDIVDKNKKLLMTFNNPLSIRKFYKSKLYELNKQLEKINKNISNPPSISIIKKLFWGKKNKISTCSKCKETERSEKEKIIYLSFNLLDINDYFDISKNISGTKNYEKNKKCEKKEVEADFNIKCNYDLPNIILIILYNCKKKTKINFVLSKKNIGIQYDLICFITQSGEMAFKETNHQWYLYSIKSKENKKIEMNQDEIEKYNPIVFFYQKIEKKVFLHEAIIEYVKLQKEIKNFGDDQVKQLYLVQKQFFDDILELIGISQDNLINSQGQVNMNVSNNIQKKIEENKKELMSMGQIKIIDFNSLEDNLSFVNENILNKLGIEKEEYENKQMKLTKIDKNKDLIIFENQGPIAITKEGKKQLIQYLDTKFYINNNNEKNEPILMNRKGFYDNLSNIFEHQKIISLSINRNEIDENKLENYYIINEKWFNKMKKIFESDEIYNDDNNKIESLDQEIDISNSNEKYLKIKDDIFLQRKQTLSDENLFKVEYEEKNDIKYPNKFAIVEENNLNDLLKEFQTTFINNIKNYIYKAFYGEHYLFIRDNSDKSIYFVCSQKCMEFNVEMIFNFKDDNSFKKELKKYIKNKNGFNFYFNERKINVNNSQPQSIINKEQVTLGNVIIINYISKNNNPINENLNQNQNKEIIQNKNVNLARKDNKIINNDNQDYNCCPYIKSLFLSFMKIEKLRDYFINNQNLSQKNKISILLSNFIRDFQNDKKQLPSIINNAKNEIKKLKEEIITNLNFKDLIDFILINLHKELNTKKNSFDDFSFEDYDKEAAYREFKKNFNSQNDSIISKLFFSEIETISMCHKCKMPKYTYDICKYLYFDIKNQNKVSLNYLLKDFENRTTNEKEFCRMCVEDKQVVSENKKINLCSEILIIVLNNEPNAEIEFKPKENFKNINYNLICYISKSTIENNFNVIFPSNQKWYQFQNNFNVNEVGILIPNPFVLFYEKVYDNNAIMSQMNDYQINNNQDNNLESIKQSTLKREKDEVMNKMKEIMKKGNQLDNQVYNQNNNMQMNNQMNNQNNNMQMNNLNNMQMNNQVNNQNNNMQMNNQMNNQNNNMQINNQMNNQNNQNNNMQMKNQINNIQTNNFQLNNQMNNQMNNMQINNQMNNIQMNNQMNNILMNNQMNNLQMNNQMNNMQLNNQMNNMQLNNQMNNMQINNQMNNQMNNNFNQNNCMNNNMNQMKVNNNNNMNLNNQYNQGLNNMNQIMMNNMNIPMNNSNFSNNNFNNVNMAMNYSNNNNNFNNFNNVNMAMNNSNINNNFINMNSNNLKNMNINSINNNNMIPNNINNANIMNNKIINQQMKNNIPNNNNFMVNNNQMNGNIINNQMNNNNNNNSNNNNNQMINQNNNNYLNIIVEDNKENDLITLYFEFSNKKQIYIDVKSSLYFREVIKELKEKYSWLNDLKIIDYKFNGNSVKMDKTLGANSIKDSSVINVIEAEN